MNDQLPIHAVLPEVIQALQDHNTVILQAPPGAGKSTVLPLHILDTNWLKGQRILLLEPRRLAARGVAARLANQLQEEVGKTVGYRVRFENKTSSRTRIEVLTEGILTRRLQNDSTLEDVGLVIFDEFHERSLHADLALALCREAQQIMRPDLRLLIMSATLDGVQLSKLLNNCPIITSEGRQFPVAINYKAVDPDLPLHETMAREIRHSLQEDEGDILAFLPGTAEIRHTQELLEENTSGVAIFPLYGELSNRDQQLAIQPSTNGLRKIVLTTSIAETSLTIEGVRIVVDSGYARIPKFDPRTGLTRLTTVRVTRDAADQRAGRAGRLGPGVCIRLWNETVQRHLTPQRIPEIQEADLAPLVLELAQWGVCEISTLTWLTPPPQGAITQAKNLLQQLEALDKEGRITDRGKSILRLPTHPRIAHLLLESEQSQQQALASDIAALLEERDPLPGETGADLALRIEVLRKWRNKESVQAERSRLERIDRLAASWCKLLQIKTDTTLPDHETIGSLLYTAYPERIAKRIDQNGRYRLANGKIARLPKHDILEREEWLAIAYMDGGANEGKIYLAAPLDMDDVVHLARQYRVVAWDAQKGELIARTEERIGEIIVSTSPLKSITDEERLSILTDVVRREGISALNWNDAVVQWQARVTFVRRNRSNEAWPNVQTAVLIDSADIWLVPWLTTIRKREDFARIDLLPLLQTLLSYEQQQQLERFAPEKLIVPTGSEIRLDYTPENGIPVLAVRLQELFGLHETPTINEGRTKVMIHLLSPAYRPVQVTQDLFSFWKNTYQEVRKELRMRYPKHHWPEDPWTAEAARGVKKKK
jgi:ATP-dependent helicase HrpB